MCTISLVLYYCASRIKSCLYTPLSVRHSVPRYSYLCSVEFHRAVPIHPSLLRACMCVGVTVLLTVHKSVGMCVCIELIRVPY